jgi:hypothetical protein
MVMVTTKHSIPKVSANLTIESSVNPLRSFSYSKRAVKIHKGHTSSIPILIALVLVVTACQELPFDLSAVATGEAAESSTPLESTAIPEQGLPLGVEQIGQQVRQWAEVAEAGSEFSDPEWAAIQAIGAPDTRRCGDYQTAWASASSDEVAWLEVSYPVAVYVTMINIVQSFNPNQVVEVALVGPFGRSTAIYQQSPVVVDQPCPYTLSIPIEKTSGRFDTVRITVDQSVLGLGWNEIDAVELVGELE